MQTIVANFRVIIEPELQDGKKVYNAYCPTLRVADYGDTIEQSLASIQAGIELALESLIDSGEEVPQDNLVDQVITSIHAKIPSY